MNRLIITDVDGVLLNWMKGFRRHMENKGYVHNDAYRDEYHLYNRFGCEESDIIPLVERFNQSDEYSELEPLTGAVDGMNKLIERGFRFIAVTAAGTSDKTKQMRMKNLVSVFGDNVFDDIVCVGVGASKRTVLENWAGSQYWFIEDHPSHALDAHEIGLRPIMIRHEYAKDFETDKFHVFDYPAWDSILNIVL